MPPTNTLSESQKIDFIGLIEKNDWKSILLDLIKKEKIDPWSINISFLASKYLERIQKMQETNLRIPANAILCCSILLKTKANKLKLYPETENNVTLINLDNVLPELLPTAKLRQDLITLDELVDAIEEVIQKTKSKSFKKKQKQKEIIDINLNISKFNVEEKFTEVLSLIKSKVDSYNMTTFSSLIKNYSILEVIQTFITLLYLMNKTKILMWQESFFDEIFIRLLSE